MSAKYSNQRYTARQLTEADIPTLREAIGDGMEYRLKPDGRSYHAENCFMVVEEAGKIIGTVHIFFVRPPQWPDSDEPFQIPQLNRLVIEKEYRNQGAGTFLIGAVEERVKSRGLTRLYLGVNIENTGALRLYKRLGFEVIAAEPYRTSWKYTDEDGIEQEEVEWLVDMVKKLS
ncbi:MAG: GNAT family N-acetyltransferase [Candidatus Latescibacteria bacterium]|nr:GNAT family N-acetyltransferase [Candidatus Latescibacterota bacterium]